MVLSLSLLGGFGLMVASYFLTAAYMRRREGPQPGYAGLVIMCLSMVGFLTLFYVLRRCGLSLQRGEPRDIFWLILGFVWIGSVIWTAYQRQSSGAILLDLGRSPLFKIHTACGLLMVAVAIAAAIDPRSRTQAFAFIAWSAWSFVMAGSHLEVRDRGIFINGLLPWRRIVACVATADNTVRLQLRKGMPRTLDFKLSPGRRDEFIQLVTHHTAGASFNS